MKPLRFCMLTTFYPPFNFGGDGLAVQRLARALARRGHDVTVVHDADAFAMLAAGVVNTASPEEDDIRVITLRSRLGRLSPLLSHQTGRPVVHGRRLRRLLTEEGFDVINFHNISLLGGPGVLAFGSATKIYMAHEHWLVCPTHVLWRHRRELCTGRECLRCVVRHRRPPQLWRYTGLLERHLAHVDAFIALSDFSRAKHAEFGFSSRMHTLPSFVPDLAGHAPGATPHGRPYFLFVGRLEHIKGLHDLVPLFNRQDCPDLLIVGEGDFGQQLRKLAHGNPRVRFLGTIAGDRLHRYYAHALALIAPSVCFETFGIVLIEAFRAGTPVVARRIGPFPELLEQSGAGLLFSNSEELGAILRRLATDDELRRRLGQSGRVAFEERWSEEAVIPRYLDIVRQAAEHHGDAQVAASLAANIGSLCGPS